MSTDETLTDSQLQLVPAYGSSSDGESSGPASYADLVRNPVLFWIKLGAFLEVLGKTLVYPTVCGESLDLYQLFVQVTARGGLEKVMENRKAKEVIGTFNFKKPTTNAAYIVRRNYLSMLFEFEHVYYHKKPLSSFWDRVLKFCIVKLAGSQVLPLGSKIKGVIDGKFDKGYFVTMKMGSQVLTGVIYHSFPPETPPRPKKKAKLSHVDSLRPKSHRCGYNFFFSEEYHRLKAAYAGQERSLIKEIGNKWRNLSLADREVYQVKGAKDLERYKSDMAAYKSFAASYEAGSVNAASDDAVAEADDL
ncbi:unnamed protein product [Eruca vesicaria subsp. sativa]|uniref:Uncharacterized protein n=1 Tax=Eruca vesicaria subsp. sativa TaxID=29727 RepID=A0ABC8IY78_ERUVS|nr:unnamed protein product [Eruca vesicaria subsp. sativa]